MSSAIEVFSDEDVVKHIRFQLNWYEQKSGYINVDVRALEKALLALEKLEAIKLWINRDEVAKKKYAVLNCILDGSIGVETVKLHLHEAEKP